MIDFQLQQLDHIALRVRDIHASAKWYAETLGLKQLRPKAWGEFPIMMLAGKSGIALFPAKMDNYKNLTNENGLVAFHFAFRVNNEGFEKIQKHLQTKKIEMEFQNLTFFHSIFIRDLDNYHVEITTQVKDF